MIVAYQNEEGTSIYARISDCSGWENPTSFILIDIGDIELKRVQLLEILFFPLFRKENEETVGTVSLFNREEHQKYDEGIEEPFINTDNKFDEDLENIKKKVRDQLVNTYALLKNDRKAWLKFVKRMLFTWHPDKNPHFEEKATEITKFIQNEVKRIEEGLPEENYQSYNNYGNFWNDFFKDCNDNARRDRHQRQNYYQHFQRARNQEGFKDNDDFRWNVPPSFKTNNLSAARLCLEVAKSHKKAAEDNLAAGHNMVAAYMCRMVR